MNERFRECPLRAAQVAVVAGGLLLATGCGGNASGGGDGGPERGDGLPDTVHVLNSNPLTGPAAFAGLAANKGYDLALQEINESDFLEGTTIEMEKVDTAGETQTAASQITQAIADNEVSALLGSVSSQEAVAQAPVAQQGETPIIFTQAGSDGVVIGEYTFRLTPLMPGYYPILSDFIEQQGWESIGVVYTAGTPTLSQIGEETLPAMAEELGIEITGSISTQATTQDFGAPISQILRDDPDGVAMLQVGASNPTAMRQLRQAGYDGPVLGNSGAGADNLVPAGADGAGMVWPVDFNAQMKGAATQEFVDAYRAEYDGEIPNNYSAEAYDAMWFLAKALKQAESANRIDLQAGMDAVAAEPFTGALGEDLEFTDRDLKAPGVVIRWDGEGEELLYSGSS